jgi:hypothetical protein
MCVAVALEIGSSAVASRVIARLSSVRPTAA